MLKKEMRTAIWLYQWAVERITTEVEKDGVVYGEVANGRVFCYRKLAEELETTERTILNHMNVLRSLRVFYTERTSHGVAIYVNVHMKLTGKRTEKAHRISDDEPKRTDERTEKAHRISDDEPKRKDKRTENQHRISDDEPKSRDERTENQHHISDDEPKSRDERTEIQHHISYHEPKKRNSSTEIQRIEPKKRNKKTENNGSIINNKIININYFFNRLTGTIGDFDRKDVQCVEELLQYGIAEEQMWEWITEKYDEITRNDPRKKITKIRYFHNYVLNKFHEEKVVVYKPRHFTGDENVLEQCKEWEANALDEERLSALVKEVQNNVCGR